MSKIITIGREFGSGGHVAGQLIADKLGIPYYDNELISMAIKHGGITHGRPLDKFDEKKFNPFLFESNYYGNENAPKGEPMEEVLFKLQRDVIIDIANNGPAIIVGRCADWILKEEKFNVLSVFISAPLEQRIDRIMAKYDVGESKAISLIKKHDKRRKAYYKFHTMKEWGNPKSYDYYFNTEDLSLEQIVDEVVMLYNE